MYVALTKIKWRIMKRILIFAICVACWISAEAQKTETIIVPIKDLLFIDEDIPTDFLNMIIASGGPRTIRFEYDDAGNVIRKAKQATGSVSTYGNEQENTQQTSQTLISDYDLSIKTDAGWSHVVVNILSDIELNNAWLQVHSLSGIQYYNGVINNHEIVINLSSLEKGVYLFTVTLNDTIRTRKLIKH